MHRKGFKAENIFDVVNYVILFLLAAVCLLPFVNVLAVSFSSSTASASGVVGLWPVDVNLDAYYFAFHTARFLRSMLNSVYRLLGGVSLNVILVILTAYPLSKSKKVLKGRSFFAWFFFATMLLSAGLIPSYLIVSNTGIRNTILALILPGAVPVYFVMVLLQTFRQTPAELEESALMDGAGDFRILFNIYVPLAVPALATIVVFQAVAHWNDWYSGVVYMDQVEKYPLASYLHNAMQIPSFDALRQMTTEQLLRYNKVSSGNLIAAQIMIGTLPVIIVYPFLQRFFVKGLTLGSLKG
ncbi:MAG: carbohydrate ABC transporter permease [Defluviitaleaceae bacterium]|nr:carbohydrate ABC transporter permease [Defluviitaleaceae bacterium]